MPERAALITGGSSGIGQAWLSMYSATKFGVVGLSQLEDIAGAVRFMLSTSPACIVPEIQFIRPGDTM
jgi:hypothetical protein